MQKVSPGPLTIKHKKKDSAGQIVLQNTMMETLSWVATFKEHPCIKIIAAHAAYSHAICIYSPALTLTLCWMIESINWDGRMASAFQELKFITDGNICYYFYVHCQKATGAFRQLYNSSTRS